MGTRIAPPTPTIRRNSMRRVGLEGYLAPRGERGGRAADSAVLPMAEVLPAAGDAGSEVSGGGAAGGGGPAVERGGGTDAVGLRQTENGLAQNRDSRKAGVGRAHTTDQRILRHSTKFSSGRRRLSCVIPVLHECRTRGTNPTVSSLRKLSAALRLRGEPSQRSDRPSRHSARC